MFNTAHYCTSIDQEKDKGGHLRRVSPALPNPGVRRWRLVVSAFIHTCKEDEEKRSAIEKNYKPTTLGRKNWMGSCWGESCGVEVFTRVGSHLRDSMSNGIR